MSVDSPPSSDQTNLFEAIQQRFNQSVVCELISKCPDHVNIPGGYNSRTALFAAVITNNYESVVRALIDAGADVNKTDNEGKTALLYLFERLQNREEIAIGTVRVLIDACADVNKSDNYGNTALLYALQKSASESLVFALLSAQGVDVNIADEYGKTALFYAVHQRNNESVVRALIDAGADANRTDNAGRTALFLACTESTNEGVVRALIDADAYVKTTDNEGKTALFYAVENNNENVVQTLIDAGAEVKTTDNRGETALFSAVRRRNNNKVVCKLIDSGADVNKSDNIGKTALFYALETPDNERVVGELINRGADINKAYSDGRTVLLQAIQNRYDKSVVRALIDAGADVNKTYEGKTALFHALQQGSNEDVVRKLIDAGADVNTANAYGETALCYAVYYANESVVHALIDAGADVNINDNKGRNLLFRAVECYSGNVLRILIKAGVDVNKTDESGNTALLYALKSTRGGEDVVCTLIDGGADVNIADHDSKTALFYAVTGDTVRYGNNERVVRALIDAGAKVYVTDRSGKTPLFYAIQERNNESVVRTLIDASTDLNKADYFGHTALFYAVQQYNSENIVQALIEAGAEVTKADITGQTALFYAVQQRNNENIVSALVDADNNILNMRDIYGRTAMLYADFKSPQTFAYLLEKGGKRCLQLKDNCNVNIVTLVIENCLSKTGEMFMENNDSDILGELPKQGLVEREGVAKDILNIMFRKYISDVLNWHSIETMAAPQDLKIFKGLAKLYKNYVDNNVWQRKKKMERLIKLLEQECRNTTKILETLIELGADPDSADCHGNTALHYATRLPLSSAAQDLVMGVCRHLKELAVRFNTKNHQNQTPLLFCLTFDMPQLSKMGLQLVIKSVVDVCIFLLNNGSSIEETSRNGESVFHLIVKLFQEGLKLHEKAREVVLRNLFRLLQWFPTTEVETSMAVNKLGKDLNSPLHLWASLTLPSPSEYSSSLTEDHTFEDIIQLIFKILLKCGAKLNRRNEDEDTPLHLCKTWAAVKMLIKAGANTNDLNSSKRSPLLVAAKNNSFTVDPDCFYPDVSQEIKAFWKETLEMGLNPWTVDIHDESVLSILVESEAYLFAKSLVDVACEDRYTKSEAITISLLNALCKDKSIRTNWKANLVQNILKWSESTTLSKPLRYCCENVLETGVRDVKQEDKTGSAVVESLAEGDDDDAPPAKRRRTDESDGKSETQADLYQGPVTVHCEIIKLLRWYGAGVEACEEIAKEYSQLSDLLLKPLTDDQIKEFIPWTSVSKKYEDKLAKVARRQEYKVIDQISIWYHKDHIGSGSFGHIFAGINEKDGREVAIKRIVKLHLQRPEDKREIQNLTALADCQQVVRYVSFFEDQDFCYVVLELMEGNLEEYLNESTIDVSEATLLCKDVVMGLKFLHEHNTLHRDLKPQNILYKTHPKLCLKIADFGLSRRIDSTSTTVYGTNAGTRCWIAPELLNSNVDHSKSSDIFSCGLLLHYILSEQQHPFSPADCANKSEIQVAHETEDNLMKGKMEGWNNSLSPEASHLVRKMIASTVKNRPTAEEAIDHPLFWTKKKKLDLLIAVGNQSEFTCPRANREGTLTGVDTDLNNSFGAIVKYRSWKDLKYLHVDRVLSEMKRKSYNSSSAVELVRFIRNAYSHVSELKVPAKMLEDFVFLEYFPALVMEVYRAVTTHGWDQTRDEIKYAMNK